LTKLWSKLFFGGKCPPPGGEKISANVILRKNMKREEKKGENVREKRKKGKKKEEKGREKEKMGSKKIK
jgi:protoporphyrinogen oxidase